MQNGICKLCEKDSNLQNSHLIPASVYKRLQSRTAPNPNPVLIKPGTAFQTSRQTTTYLLCSVCENVLNSKGEKQVLPLLAKEDLTFPLYDLIIKVPPDCVLEKIVAYAAARNPEIPVQALTHFALGTFWKASVHHWHGNDTNLQINLGPCEKSIRLFVRDPEKTNFRFYVPGIQFRTFGRKICGERHMFRKHSFASCLYPGY
jgi:hypothetical protein